MPLIGIVAKKKDIQSIRKEICDKNIDIIEITENSIKNIKNIKFEEIILLENINLKEEEYRYMNEIISKAKYCILNGDVEIDILPKIRIATDIITMGFNSKSTISISSVKEDKFIVYIQNDIKKTNNEIIEAQEKEIISKNNRKIYNNLAVFIIKELHNL